MGCFSQRAARDLLSLAFALAGVTAGLRGDCDEEGVSDSGCQRGGSHSAYPAGEVCEYSSGGMFGELALMCRAY